jgi:transposase
MDMARTDLQQLREDELTDFEPQLQWPDKVSRMSSKSASTNKKEKQDHSHLGGAKPGHEPRDRRPAEDTDEFRHNILKLPAQRGGPFSSGAERLSIGEYDDIGYSLAKSCVVRDSRFARQCGMEAEAPATQA